MRNSLITRYIAAELLAAFSVAVGLVTFVLVLIVVAQEAIRMNLGVWPTLRLLPFVLPTSLAFAVPAALLFAICLVYGRMSADNEIAASKSLGISPLVLLGPAWFLAFGLSLVCVWLNDLAYSWGAVGVQQVVVQSLEEIAYGMLRTQKSFSNPKFSITVKDVEGRKLIRPIIHMQANNDMPALMVSAVEAELSSDLSKNTLKLRLQDCEVETGAGLHSFWPGVTEQEYPLAFFSARDLKAGSPTQLPLWQLPGDIALQHDKIRELEQSLAAESALALVTGELGELNEANWKQRRKKLTDARLRLFRLRTESPRRWANGFSVLFFVFVGAPLAILMRKADYVSTFGSVFLPVLLIYYPLSMACVDRAKSGELTPLVVWLPNLVLVLVGFWFLKRVVRY